MGQYFSLVGKQVRVEYRLGTMHLYAIGRLTADQDEFVCVEQYFKPGESARKFNLKIPYICIVRLNTVNPNPSSADS